MKLNTQWEAHRALKGIDPVIATREHSRSIHSLIDEVMQKSGLSFSDLSCVAVTSGPGLAYCLEVGIKKAKAIVQEHNLPLIGVNHMEGHTLTARLTNPEVEFPFLVFLVSGGHTQLTLCRGLGDYVHLGSTLDNALGEVYDKIARELNVSYVKEGVSGGEAVEELAKTGNPKAYPMELPLRKRVSCDFSFSGILSYYTRIIKEKKAELQVTDLPLQDKADYAASFQNIVLAHIEKNTMRAIKWVETNGNLSTPLATIVISGGVARNAALRARMRSIAERACVQCVFPPARWCTDNGVMIAWAGMERWMKGGMVDKVEDVVVRPRWPLDQSGEVHFPVKSGNKVVEIKHKSNYVVNKS